MKTPKILLAMSGGVDSSVAALLMKNKGYEIIGAFMKNWSDTKNDLGECTWRGERRYALKIAAMLNIPLITLDFEKEYRNIVVEKMYKDYKKGITPNPDVDCNEKIKFPLLIKAAKKLKCDFVVTGHYARIKRVVIKEDVGDKNKVSIINNKTMNKKVSRLTSKNKISERSESILGWEGGKKFQYSLLRAKDESKDQSYFLYRLKQNELKNILFPIGDLTKKEVREIAQKNNFPNYNKKSTVGICFIGKVNLKKFLQKRIKPQKGKILNPEGKQIGEHDGIFYYTIGQRIGPRFGIEIHKTKETMQKWYVARKILKTNTIIAAPENHQLNFRKEIYLNKIHWISSNPFDNNSKKNKMNNKNLSLIKNKSTASEVSLSLGGWVGKNKPIKVFSRIRQVGELLPSILELKNTKYKVTLKKAITGISEGQAIVLYQGKKCIGGGIISFQ